MDRSPEEVAEICDDGLDNEGDGQVDCEDLECALAPGCRRLVTGEGCERADQCRASQGKEPVCLDELSWGYPGGHCSEVCARVDDCAAGFRCQDEAQGHCLKRCMWDRDCTRPGYRCLLRNADREGVCFPSCMRDQDCGATMHCNRDLGICTASEICDDGQDNDTDGLVDCWDLDCVVEGRCPEEDCRSDQDEDLDGLISCADPTCDNHPGCQEDCVDGIDNDRNDLIDCADPACGEQPVCREDCSNGVDDNGNGFIDCAELSCVDRFRDREGRLACRHEICDDGVDNTGEGLVDCNQSSCYCRNKFLCREVRAACVGVEICSGGEDEDGDGAIDCEDSDCDRHAWCVEEICGDGVDNDHDSRIDCADLECECFEICDDGIDNDEDGRIDCQDRSECGMHPNCVEHCSDGVDGDGDGLIDCRDPDCEVEPACAE